jgi:hypothetical protein
MYIYVVLLEYLYYTGAGYRGGLNGNSLQDKQWTPKLNREGNR